MAGRRGGGRRSRGISYIRLDDPVESRLVEVRQDQYFAGFDTPRLAEEFEIERPGDRAASSIGTKEVLGANLKHLLCDVVGNGA